MDLASYGSSASAYSTFFLFSTSMAVGVGAVLPWIPVGQIGRRFHVLLSLIALVFVALAVVGEGLGISPFYGVFAAFLIVYNEVIRERG